MMRVALTTLYTRLCYITSGAVLGSFYDGCVAGQLSLVEPETMSVIP